MVLLAMLLAEMVQDCYVFKCQFCIAATPHFYPVYNSRFYSYFSIRSVTINSYPVRSPMRVQAVKFSVSVDIETNPANRRRGIRPVLNPIGNHRPIVGV